MKIPAFRPIYGWRTFSGEVGIIVIGVLIALGAQQLVEHWQWRQRTDDARIRLAREVGAMSGQLYERLIVQRCLLDRLAGLADGLEKSGPAWRGAPEQFFGSQRYFSNKLPVAAGCQEGFILVLLSARDTLVCWPAILSVRAWRKHRTWPNPPTH